MIIIIWHVWVCLCCDVWNVVWSVCESYTHPTKSVLLLPGTAHTHTPRSLWSLLMSRVCLVCLGTSSHLISSHQPQKNVSILVFILNALVSAMCMHHAPCTNVFTIDRKALYGKNVRKRGVRLVPLQTLDRKQNTTTFFLHCHRRSFKNNTAKIEERYLTRMHFSIQLLPFV